MQFYSIKENFINANIIFQEINYLLTIANKNLIWDGKARNKFDENFEILKKDFEYLSSKIIFLESNFDNLSLKYQNFLSP